MFRALLAAFCLSAALAHADNHQEDLAYSLGTRLGERLRAEVPDLPLSELLQGLRQAYQGEALRLSNERIEELLEAHEQRIADDPQRHAQAIAAQRVFLAEQRASPNVRVIEGGVLVSELRAGSGARPAANGRVQVRYSGRLADGQLFDESQNPQWFRLDSLIKGWRSALQQMPVGAKWRLVVPSDQAYGEAGAGDLIPPHAALVFDVELLDVAD